MDRLENIAVEHDEIRALSCFQTAGRVLLLQRERGVDRVGIDDVLERSFAPGAAAVRLASRCV